MSKDCTIQDVFHRFYSSFESTHSISPAQRKAAYHIMNCKTGAFGVNVSVCEDCGCISVHYNSCRDRCCPMCQEFPKEKWVDARREDILDAPYFHVVFTVPEELNPIIYSNQKFLYTALYHAASDTLSELAADSKYLGTDIGYICILHTWGSTMNFHPHIHAMDCQHFFRQIFLGYFSDIVQAFDTLRKNVCGDDYTSLHNPIVLSSVLPAYGMFHSIQILFL